MNEKERLTLQKFHASLVKDIIPSETFLAEFIQQGILDFDLKEEILNETTDTAKNAKFLSILPRRGPKAFPVLLQVLERTSPWIKEELETFYNKQKLLNYHGDVESLLAPAHRQPSSDDTSPKSISRALSIDTGVQTEPDEEEDGVKLNQSEVTTLGNIYLRLVTYLHSQGHKEFDIAVSVVELDELDRVVREILNVVSTKHSKLTQIMDQFDENDKERAGNDVCKVVEYVLSEKASLKRYLDTKDTEVMQLEKDFNQKIKTLESKISDLLENKEKEHNHKAQLENQLLEKDEEIQRMKEAEKKRQEEPLLKRMHNLIEEVTHAKSQKEKQMYETGQEYQDLMEETKCIEDLLYQLKGVHDYHVTHQGKNAVRNGIQYQRTDYRRSVLHNAGNGGQYNRMRGNGPSGLGTSNMSGKIQLSSPRMYGCRRRLKRSPHTQNRQRNTSENMPMSPKQKSPRYQQPTLGKQMTEMQVENRPVTRQSTNLTRISRQETDLSLQSGYLISPSLSRQSTGYQSAASRQNTSVGRRTSSRQSRISLDLPLSARNRPNGVIRNGSDIYPRTGQSRASIRSEEASPLPSGRQTSESPHFLFNGTSRTGETGNLGIIYMR